MQNIILIGSSHLEYQNCTAVALCKIIETIKPEIIFEEIQYDRFNAYYIEKSAFTLETDAINMYLEKNKVEHIPVDTYDFSYLIKDEINYMNRVISQNNKEYDQLFKQYLSLTFQYGFPYLNSDQSMELLDKIHIIENDTIKALNNDELNRIYNIWRETTVKREDEILRNIYKYSKENKYNNGILIIGAEHKKSLLNKIKEYNILEEIELNWKAWRIE